MSKYEYIFAGDLIDDGNNGLVYGVQDYDTDAPGATFHIKWFNTIAKLEAYTKRQGFRVTNRDAFLAIHTLK